MTILALNYLTHRVKITFVDTKNISGRNQAMCDSLIEAVRYYSDLNLCEQKMAHMKWESGIPVCPKCDGQNIGRVASRRLYQCKAKDCRKQFTVKVGTIFEDSPLGLDKWFVAVWCIANAKNGISSHELGRALKITQKSAWFMLHRIREAMKSGSFRKLQGEVESDETFIGGKSINMHAHKRSKKIMGRGTAGKTAVHGLLERQGEVRTFVVSNADESQLVPNVVKHVEVGAKVYTDKASAYRNLSKSFLHSTVDHISEYVRGRVHTNCMENFWSLLKRCIHGTWIHIAPFHVERYADEQAWRYNNRKRNDGSRFNELLSTVVGRRLTWKRLCRQEQP